MSDDEAAAAALIASIRSRGHTLVLRGRHPHLSGSGFRSLTPAEREVWRSCYSVVRDLLLREAEAPPGVAVSPADGPPAPENIDVPPAPQFQPPAVSQSSNPFANITAPIHEKAERHARQATQLMWRRVTGKTYRE